MVMQHANPPGRDIFQPRSSLRASIARFVLRPNAADDDLQLSRSGKPSPRSYMPVVERGEALAGCRSLLDVGRRCPRFRHPLPTTTRPHEPLHPPVDVIYPHETLSPRSWRYIRMRLQVPVTTAGSR
jgi:hypothetical protein